MDDTGDSDSSNVDSDNGDGSADTPDSDAGGADSDTDTADSPDSNTDEPADEPAGDQQVLSDETLPDFSVVDVNVGSLRYEEAVSPRYYLGRISAWYFGSAT